MSTEDPKQKKSAKLTPEEKAKLDAAKPAPRPQSQSQVEKDRADWEGMAQPPTGADEDA